MLLVHAFALSAAIAATAWRLRALTGDGAVAAIAVGTAILATTGWPGCAVLGAFFGSSSLVSRLWSRAGDEACEAKGETRDRWQVLANGGVAAVAAIAAHRIPGLGIWLVTIVLAAAASDTWATALGALSTRPPRDILRGARVAPGTSGGVTWLGTGGGLAGAALVGLVGLGVTGSWILFTATAAIGFGAMVVDSMLGASVQGRFHCPRCDRATERRIHRCGERVQHQRGWRWLDNDGVNAMATGFAALAGLAFWVLRSAP